MSAPQSVSAARNEVREVAPKLIDLSEKVLYGDVWERPGLSKRDRSLITVAALIAMYRTDQLSPQLERALSNGVSPEEIGEVITQMAFYGGWPAAMSAGRIAKKVFDERKKP
ncbi:MAG TPA: carboxymuconolactone decarboxylase family protein [Thermodesulfobacteriota bacterium]|nr:carboxymuconolactone decarboxylase family protein [Thermodesulfobacteriota bacterium]